MRVGIPGDEHAELEPARVTTDTLTLLGNRAAERPPEFHGDEDRGRPLLRSAP
jgi:hypothetical protein